MEKDYVSCVDALDSFNHQYWSNKYYLSQRSIKFYSRLLLKSEKALNSYIKQVDSKSSEKDQIEYNRSLLMPYYVPEVIEALARKRMSPMFVNDIGIKKHKYGEEKEKAYQFQLAIVQVMEDVCRINNWTTRKDMNEHKVPVNQIFKDLYAASVEYSDILRYYAKKDFEMRAKNLLHK